jgi:hypothetical protein
VSNNGNNNWNVGYPAIEFLEGVLKNHSKVQSFTRCNDIQFEIKRRNGLPNVNAVLVEAYMFGEASLYGVLKEFCGVTTVEPVSQRVWR